MATKDTNSTATPENTPIPGGGRWCWSDALPGWVEVLEDPSPAPTTAATPVDQPIEMKE